MVASRDDEERTVLAFLERYWADHDGGRVESLAHYLALYPGFEEAVAREYIAARGQDETPDAESWQTTDGGPGGQLGPFRILSEIGRGGQGTVYLAEDVRLRRRVALKVLAGLGPGAGEVLERFHREAQVASKLHHEGICAVLDAGVHAGVPYIAMEYVEGESLAKLIQTARASGDDSSFFVTGEASASQSAKGALAPPRGEDLERVLRVIERTARALHAAHEAGIVHRDVKPGNIIVRPEDHPVLLDFGLARDSSGDARELTRTGDLFGTPAYMSPEQIAANQQGIDRRTDVWSLGVALYECVTLRNPFEAPTRQGMYDAIRNREPADPRTYNDQLSPDLRIVLETALAKEPDARYQTALELADEISRVLRNESIHARSPGPTMRLRRWARRNPALASLSLAIVVVVVIALAIVSLALERALTQRARAEDMRQQAHRNLLAYARLSDSHLVSQLTDEADDLWPAHPETVPALEHWMQQARDLASRLPDHEQTLRSLRGRAMPYTEHDRQADRDAGSADERSTWRFESVDDQWRHDVMSNLVTQLRELAGVAERVADRLRFARTVRRRTIDMHEELWRETIEAIRTAPMYDELALSPQVGLVPLGADPVSGLHEFAHLQTGAVPARGDHGLETTDDTGLVFVLVPGGKFRMGASATDPKDRPYDPQAAPEEQPVHEIELAPFFLSKYEMTQGQWQRITGSDPSARGAGTSAGGTAITLSHPVESVSWSDASHVLGRLGLALPTEAQWEHAARAGTQSAWFTGDDVRSLKGFANLFGGSTARAERRSVRYVVPFADGFAYHAPVGRFHPNAFGLHDTCGNVGEWVADAFAPYTAAVRDGDGRRVALEHRIRIHRGGSWGSGSINARSAARSRDAADAIQDTIGLRPARAIRP